MTEAEADRIYVENMKAFLARIAGGEKPFRLRIYDPDAEGEGVESVPETKEEEKWQSPSPS